MTIIVSASPNVISQLNQLIAFNATTDTLSADAHTWFEYPVVFYRFRSGNSVRLVNIADAGPLPWQSDSMSIRAVVGTSIGGFHNNVTQLFLTDAYDAANNYRNGSLYSMYFVGDQTAATWSIVMSGNDVVVTMQ